MDYRYNIRGWLTKINDVQNPNPEDLWNFSLHYDCGFEDKQFNGNIAGQTWCSLSDGIERAYGYRYDNVNRLLQGDFVARTSTSPTSSWGAERGNYRFAFASYDAGGNLLTLRRRGLVAAATRTMAAQYGETDNLRYRYEPATSSEPISNRLQRVDDLAPAASTFAGKQPERPDFSDGSTSGATTPDYTYDAAGSMTSDRNKGISRISYNYLHLPELIEWSNGNKLQYVYTATGQKVGKLATAAAVAGKPTPPPVRTDYLGAWQYERDSLRWLTHAEGRALMIYRRDAAGGITSKVQYEYTLKDHLGNLRVAFHPGERSSVLATMEESQRDREIQQFDSASIESTRTFVGPQFGHNGTSYVAKLNAGGTQPKPLGPLKQLSIARGDTILVTAYGLYNEAPKQNNWGFSLASFVASLLQQQPAATPPSAEGTRRVRVLPLLSAGLTATALPVVQQLTSGVPKAYLRILVFNSDSVLVANQPLPQMLSKSAEGNYEHLQLSVVVPQAGYVQAYVANESDTDVFFDDITVEHRQGLQVQENQYDPYGLDLAGLSKTATPQNQYSWNGKEKQTEFSLNWHDHGWRFYDPTLGRWVVSDPAAEEGDQESWGTYQFGLDNAIRYNDLDGRCPGGCVTSGIDIGGSLKASVKKAYHSAKARVESYLQLSPDDKKYIKAHPFKAAEAGLIRMHATSIANRTNVDPPSQKEVAGSKTNTLRHALGAAMADRDMGSDGKQATDAHEGAAANVLDRYSKQVQQLMNSGRTIVPEAAADSFVDQLNNAAGRKISSLNPGASTAQLTDLSLQALAGSNKDLPRLYMFTLQSSTGTAVITATKMNENELEKARASINEPSGVRAPIP
ncbi:RHS repeat-associated protein [Hymenobacter luteus]|uniref:RHS repeat-associated protein n=2 Tax=Hymenobacter TaxID=89966 RepID=A0A7W9T4T3_9BACT|nr:RHS repeat-associated core domain-containing protein [Hymenobacter latericoloratus]MBB4603685.1 RHS repeat-associated protein [Hymenobacter latericoloratus]MBB6061466.1 RHS repeat-associated protein [Hymenobacter luteus]